MANRELPIYIMQYQKLKQKFPEIPDNIILKFAKLYPEDIQKCIHYLNEFKKSPAENKINRNNNNVNRMPEIYGPVPLPTTVNATFQMPHPISNISNIDSHTGVNGLSGPASIDALTQGYPSKYGHSSGVRSSSVSGASTARSHGDFHSSITVSHPQSAPVMPAHYEPFHVEYSGHAEVSIRPSVVHPSNQAPYVPLAQQRSRENFYELPEKLQLPYNHFKYEMQLQYNQALINHQQAQMAKFHEHLMGEKQKLEMVKSDVNALKEELKRKRSYQNPIIPYEKIEHLRVETRLLRIQCDSMSKEVDSLVKGNGIPLGETDLGFYENINPGQCGSVGVPRRTTKPLPKISHPPPPPPPLPSNEDENRQWSCSTCTFLNNIALDKCEMCEMPRLMLASNFT